MSKKTLTWILGIALLLLPMCAGTFESVASAEPVPREAEDASRTPTTQQGDTNQLAETDAGPSATSAPADSIDSQTWLSENKSWLFSGVAIGLPSLVVGIIGLSLVCRSKRAEQGSPQVATTHGTQSPSTPIQARDIGGDLSIGNSTGLDGDGLAKVVESAGESVANPLCSVITDLSSRLEDANREIGRWKERAIHRAEEGEKKGEPQATAALAAVRKTGDTELLLKYLLALREGGVGGTAELNREIAAVAYLRGEIQTAQAALSQILEVLPDDMFAINVTGQIHTLRGDLEKAQAAYERIGELADSANDPHAQAVAYGNLGILHSVRGDLDKAEEMFNKSLKLFEQLGNKEGRATSCGNLGNVYFTRGELDKAEKMYSKALKLDEQLGNKEGRATSCGNLGIVYKTRGELDKAEIMYSKALKLNKQLGNKEGMARDYGNLGILYKTRGELDKAEEMYNKAMELFEQLGSKEGMATSCGNLGNVCYTRGDLGKAQQMHNKALELNEQLGSKKGMANACGNLGIVYEQRGELARAREYWIKARDLYSEIGIPHEVQEVQGWIDELDAAQ